MSNSYAESCCNGLAVSATSLAWLGWMYGEKRNIKVLSVQLLVVVAYIFEVVFGLWQSRSFLLLVFGESFHFLSLLLLCHTVSRDAIKQRKVQLVFALLLILCFVTTLINLLVTFDIILDRTIHSSLAMTAYSLIATAVFTFILTRFKELFRKLTNKRKWQFIALLGVMFVFGNLALIGLLPCINAIYANQSNEATCYLIGPGLSVSVAAVLVFVVFADKVEIDERTFN